MNISEADFMDISEKETLFRTDLSSKAKAMAMGKVCAIMGMDRDLGIFLLDLDRNYDDVKDANGFVDIQPNFRLKGGDENLVFYVVNATLYLFYIFQGRGASAPIPKVYSIDLQAVSEMSNVTLDKTDFQPRADCLAAKSLPTSLAYRGGGTKLLIFSTNIRFHFCNVDVDDFDGGDDSQIMVDKSVIDFEIYDTEGGVSTPLPQLIVCCLPSRTDVFMLYDSRKSTCYAEFPGNYRGNSLYMMSFDIVSFGVDEDRFIIQTDFGRMFSLDLKLGDDRWRLCEEEGYEFDGVYKNILAPNGICLDAAGANDSRKKWLQSDGDGDGDGDARKRAKFGDGIRSRSRRVRFPETEIEKYGLRFRYGRYNSSSFDLLKVEDDPSYNTRCCILQQAFDFIGAFAVQEISTKLYMCLDVLKLNLEEFPAPAAADDDKFVKRIMSVIFTVSEMIQKPVPHVEGLFYY